MRRHLSRALAALAATALTAAAATTATASSAEVGDEPFRPPLHFTPEKNWMNDPNGMVSTRAPTTCSSSTTPTAPAGAT